MPSKKKLRFKFFSALLVMSIALCGGMYWASVSFEKSPSLSDLFFVVAFFFLLTGFSYYFLTTRAYDRPQQFVTRFMATLVAKILLSVVFLAVYVVFNREHAVFFTLAFLACYLLFSVLEVPALQKIARSKI